MAAPLLLAVDGADARDAIRSNPERDWTDTSVVTLSQPRGSGMRPLLIFVTFLARLDPSYDGVRDQLLHMLIAPGGQVVDLPA